MSSPALRRLKKEYASLDKESPPGVLIVRPLETNFLHAHFLLEGPAFYDTPYEGGVYHGVLQFPPSYPMKPPAVIMRTPSGRFQPDKKICFSMSDYHEDLWNPMWNIGTILTGLVSFMNSAEITTGGMSAPASARRAFAKQSLQHVMQQDALAKELFANVLNDLVAERAKNGNVWPPVRPPPPPKASKQEPKPAASTFGSRASSRRSKRAKSKGVQARNNEAEEEQPDPEPESPVSNGKSPSEGKNAAKNRKKREREKRKKLTRSFLSNLREQTPVFLTSVLDALDRLDVNVSEYPADHVCWRTESLEEYTDLVAALKGAADDARLLVESEIGGRSIATFALLEPIECNDGRAITVVEIPAPKDGRPYKQGLEHVEFVIGGNDDAIKNAESQRQMLDDFMKNHPGVDWNTKAIDKFINPDVSAQVEVEGFGLCTVKFHLLPLSKVIDYEKEVKKN